MPEYTTAEEATLVAAAVKLTQCDGYIVLAVDPQTGAQAEVSFMPTAGYVRLSASVNDIPPGERCRMVVVAKDGTREVAFSWVTGEALPGGAPLTGSTSTVPPTRAAARPAMASCSVASSSWAAGSAPSTRLP